MFLFSTTPEVLNHLDPDNPEARGAEKQNVAPLLTPQKDKEFFSNISPKINRPLAASGRVKTKI